MSKLLLITEDFFPLKGGVARYYSALADELNDVTVFTCVNGEDKKNVIRKSWYWSAWPHWLPLLWLVPYLKFKTKARFLGAGQILPIGTALLLMRLAFGWRYIVFLHGLDIALTQTNKKQSWLARIILKYATLVVVNSEFTKSLAIKAGADKPHLLVVYPCSNLKPALSNDVQVLRQRYNLVNKLVLLSVSRLVKRKGIDDVLKVLPQLQREFSNLIYVVVGDGPEKNNLEEQAKSLNCNVIFTSEVDDNELSAWYDICDIFVLAPKNETVDVEGFGIVYLEARRAGKPIIASRVGGVPEAVGVGGVLVNNGELLFKMRQLLDDESQRLLLGKNGQEGIDNFNWKKQALRLKNFLDKF
jgi:phosphatidylinositol alpha-1,6-mannosyltransferase